MNLKERCDKIKFLFDSMDGEQASNWQKNVVEGFRKNWPILNDDLDFCFEVLAGKHKVGITFNIKSELSSSGIKADIKENLLKLTIKEYYQNMQKGIAVMGTGYIQKAYEEDVMLELGILTFMTPLINREYRLGYSNKAAMVTDKSPMLAKKWEEERYKIRNKKIFIQEKYDGNRCIAWFEEGKWRFQSRRGKEQKVFFDMDNFVWPVFGGSTLVFDGELITKRGDFSKASGIINSIDGAKDKLVYMIYDIIDPELTYEERKNQLAKFEDTEDVKVAPILAEGLYRPVTGQDIDEAINKVLGEMVAIGGEGIMIRIGDSKYEPGKRSLALLKYKLVQSMDMLCTGFIPGTGKYEDMIGSLNVELKTDDGQHITTSVGTGLKDWERDLDPSHFIGKIIEVEYFEKCQNQAAGPNEWSLRFPRFKGVRNDKTTTSSY